MFAWFNALLNGMVSIIVRLSRIERKSDWVIETLGRIESIGMTNQEKLDAVAEQLGTLSSDLAGDVQSLKDQIAAGTTPENLDFSALDARVQALSDLDAQTPGTA